VDPPVVPSVKSLVVLPEVELVVPSGG